MTSRPWSWPRAAVLVRILGEGALAGVLWSLSRFAMRLMIELWGVPPLAAAPLWVPCILAGIWLMGRDRIRLVTTGRVIACSAVVLLAVPVLLMSVYPPAPHSLASLGLQPVDAAFVPGGEGIKIYIPCGDECTECGVKAHVSMYLGDGAALLTGHSSTALEPGREYRAALYGDGDELETDAAVITVVADTPVGQLVSGLPVPGREPVQVGAAVEGPAVIVRYGRLLPATIEGADRDGKIVIGVPRGLMGPGDSGAPVLQDGALVGIVRGGLRGFPQWVLATPACRALLAVDEALDGSEPCVNGSEGRAVPH